jgi:hypothetical protein
MGNISNDRIRVGGRIPVIALTFLANGDICLRWKTPAGVHEGEGFHGTDSVRLLSVRL